MVAVWPGHSHTENAPLARSAALPLPWSGRSACCSPPGLDRMSLGLPGQDLCEASKGVTAALTVIMSVIVSSNKGTPKAAHEQGTERCC